ncbi:MAG: hypothetical protein AAGA08_09835 [Pseudomonadota bacterium]
MTRTFFLPLAIVVACCATAAFSQTLTIDKSFKAVGVMEQTIAGKQRYYGLVAYKFIENRGKALLCGTLATYGKVSHNRYMSRAAAQTTVRIGETKVRRGIGYMPNTVFAKTITAKWDVPKNPTLKQLKELSERSQVANTFAKPDLKLLQGKKAKCRRTNLKWTDALGRAAVTFDFPKTVSFTRRS